MYESVFYVLISQEILKLAIYCDLKHRVDAHMCTRLPTEKRTTGEEPSLCHDIHSYNVC